MKLDEIVVEKGVGISKSVADSLRQSLLTFLSPLFSFHLFGRSLKKIPPDSQTDLTWKMINGETLCEIRFAIEQRSFGNQLDRRIIGYR